MLTLIIGGFILHIFYPFIHKKLPGIKGRESCWGDFGGDDDDSDTEAAYNTSVAPSREFEQSKMDLWKSTYEPYAKDVYNLWSSYGKPIKEAESKYYLEKGLPQTQELMGANFEDYMNLMRPYTQDQFALWSQFGKPQTEERYKQAGEVFLPAQRALGGKLAADVESPWLDTKPIFEDIWRRTREKTAAEWKPIEERTSQRLAGAGALDTGAAIKEFGNIEQGKYKSLETQAIDQALQEFNLQNQAKQSSYENMFRYLGGQPSVGGVPEISPYTAQSPAFDMSGMGQVGQWGGPEVIPPYVDKTQKSDMGGLGVGLGMLAGGLLAAPTGGMSIPMGAMIGGAMGGGAGSMIKY